MGADQPPIEETPPPAHVAGMWREYFVIGAGGALGAVSRFALAGYVGRRYGETFPWGTILINVTGCLLIGFIAEATGQGGRWFLGPLWRMFLMIGFLGGYTTFSSFGLQTLNLARADQWLGAALNVILSVTLCLLAVWIGHGCAALVNRGRP
jgi:CrcB protein